jgi:superfamily II RNA helicase
MDEFHYYSDRERGVAWQIPLITLPQSRFLLMSATLGNTSFFESELLKHTGLECVTVRSMNRPVPLEFSYSDQELLILFKKALSITGTGPVLVVHITQADAITNAQNFMIPRFLLKRKELQIQKA